MSMQNLKAEKSSTMMNHFMSRCRRQKLRYVVVFAFSISLTWVTYWFVFSSSHEESELERIYNQQNAERIIQAKSKNPYPPKVNQPPKHPSVELGHIKHGLDVWQKPGKNQRGIPGIRVHQEVREEDKKFPVIKNNDHHLSKQLGVSQEDLDRLQRKVIGNDVLGQKPRNGIASPDDGVPRGAPGAQSHFGPENPFIPEQQPHNDAAQLMVDQFRKVHVKAPARHGEEPRMDIFPQQNNDLKTAEEKLLRLREQEQQKNQLLGNQQNARNQVIAESLKLMPPTTTSGPHQDQAVLKSLDNQFINAQIRQLSDSILQDPSSPDIQVRLQQLAALKKQAKLIGLPLTGPQQAAPAQQFPQQAAPAQQFPQQAALAQQFPQQAAPAQQVPKQAAPAQQFPKQAAPAQQFPQQTAPAQQFPKQVAPAQQLPHQKQYQLPQGLGAAGTPVVPKEKFPQQQGQALYQNTPPVNSQRHPQGPESAPNRQAQPVKVSPQQQQRQVIPRHNKLLQIQGIHSPGQNPLQQGQAVHSPGQNPLQQVQGIHSPEQNPLQQGQSIHSPGQNLLQQGQAIHSPGQNPLPQGQTIPSPGQNPLQQGQGNPSPGQSPLPQDQAIHSPGQNLLQHRQAVHALGQNLLKEPQRSKIDQHDEQMSTNTKDTVDKVGGGTGEKPGTYTMVHAGTASVAIKKSPMKPIPESVEERTYVFQSDSLPSETRFRPCVGNGHIATTIHNKHIFLSGFYNGYREQSHRAEIPTTVAVKFLGTEPPSNCTRSHILNTGAGVYSETCSQEFYTVTERIFAHRTIVGLLVLEIDLVMEASYPLVLQLDVTRWQSSYDLTFRSLQHNMTNVSLKVAKVSAPETEEQTYDEVFVMYDHVPKTLTPPSGVTRIKWVFLTAVGASRSEVTDMYMRGNSLIHSSDQLYASHVQAWSNIWQNGLINVKGNVDIARAVFGSWYYLLSSTPLQTHSDWPFVGLSPTSLATGSFDQPQDYFGRVLVDQELWMFPAILAFHPNLAKVVLGSRSRSGATRGAAKLAEKNGIDSALQYPWQAGITGQELTKPGNAQRDAVYVSGLVSHAVLQYLTATNDTSILQEEGYLDILGKIATYYFKELKQTNAGTSYGLLGVQTPDRFARSVENSAFTNAVAARALLAPEIASERIGRSYNLNYRTFSENVYVPLDLHEDYHPEHDSYRQGTAIHQADSVLLGYPLMWEMNNLYRRMDLVKYEKVLDPRAPPTSWAMHAIGWLEVNEIDKGNQAFGRQFAYIKNDFQVWTEQGTTYGACNYISAAGAFLQSITHGYLGLRYHDNYIDINPVLPPGVSELQYLGVNYLTESLEILVWEDRMSVQVQRTPSSQEHLLNIFTSDPPSVKKLLPGNPVVLPRKKAKIFTKDSELPEDL